MTDHEQFLASAIADGVTTGNEMGFHRVTGRKWNFAKRAHSELGLLKSEISLENKFMDDPSRMHRISLVEAEAGWTI